MTTRQRKRRETSDEGRGSRSSRREFRFERIEAWQLARQFNRQVYAISRKFPKEEQFALLPQIRRASTSVGSNIAEGSGRNSEADLLAGKIVNLSKSLGRTARFTKPLASLSQVVSSVQRPATSA